ncbi:hypothetical protein [Allorhizocola rhizosphaerae]|uniref:hypothetical protein n=1 Tax=Allorhizocola rhizosphaerae TaxID=1872709 RepID=UPI001B8CF71E|nr:hypothetical protein [Allorhizocola rhizosphaerae]
MSNRALQRKHGVGFRTVTAALESAWPKERKQPPKRGSRLDAYRVVIDDWLRSDLDAPRKQRHTAKRIFDRLLDEHDGAGVVSYWMVREYVATRRREIRVEVGREPANAFIPQEHLPGREALCGKPHRASSPAGTSSRSTVTCARRVSSGTVAATHRRNDATDASTPCSSRSRCHTVDWCTPAASCARM